MYEFLCSFHKGGAPQPVVRFLKPQFVANFVYMKVAWVQCFSLKKKLMGHLTGHLTGLLAGVLAGHKLGTNPWQPHFLTVSLKRCPNR